MADKKRYFCTYYDGCEEYGEHVIPVGGEWLCPLHRKPFYGIGGAPSRATTLPADAKARKTFPVASGFLDYFPDAVCAVANLSFVGNEQHNPGQPLHWDRSKSRDEADTMMRHFLQRGTFDTDGVRHSAKMVWRALAILQKELEETTCDEGEKQPPSFGLLPEVPTQHLRPKYPDQPSGVQ